ncbi:MAG: beta strand repeat-containing protein [Pirellulaceae bacterium]
MCCSRFVGSICTLVLILGLSGLPAADAQPVTWLGGNGNWSAGGNWSSGSPPNSNTIMVLLDDGNPVNSIAALDINAVIESIVIDSGDQLNILSGRTLTLDGPSSTNNGIIEFNPVNLATLNIDGDLTLGGSGRMVLGATASNASFVQGLTATDRLTNGMHHTIEGRGNLGNDMMSLTNEGLVIGNNSAGPLVVDPGSGDVINNHFMQAADGGTLQLNAGLFTNTNGTIKALADSIVNFNGGTISGGILSSTGTGKFTVGSGQTGTLTGGSITNDATIEFNPVNLATLNIDGDLTLSGSGRMVLGVTASNASFVQGLTATDRLTNGANHTIEGRGNLGNDMMSLTNEGLVIGNNAAGALVVDPGSGDVINNKFMQAADGGTLQLNAGLFTNTNGTIKALAGSIVNFNGGTISGGILSSTGTGKFTVGSNQTVTLTGGSITNDATIEFNPVGPATLNIDGDLTLGGSGRMVLGVSASNASFVQGLTATDRLTNGINHTIEGRGNLGNDMMSLTNEGLIIANIGILAISLTDNYLQTGGITRLDGGNISTSVLLDIQGGILEGDGFINGNVQIGNTATVAPGLSAGQLTINGSMELFDGSLMDIELGGLVQGAQYDFFDVNGDVVLGGALQLSLIDGFGDLVLNSDSFTILESNNLAGVFDNVANGDFLVTSDGLFKFQVNYGAGSAFNENYVVLGNATAIPEPSVYLFMALVIVLLLVRRRHPCYPSLLD